MVGVSLTVAVFLVGLITLSGDCGWVLGSVVAVEIGSAAGAGRVSLGDEAVAVAGG